MQADGELRVGFPVALFKLPRCVPPKNPQLTFNAEGLSCDTCHKLACLHAQLTYALSESCKHSCLLREGDNLCSMRDDPAAPPQPQRGLLDALSPPNGASSTAASKSPRLWCRRNPFFSGA
jgi:hypothetical protein